MPDFVKLKDLVGQTMTIQSVGPYKFKLWDDANKKMLVSDTYQSGYRKLYPVVTDKGQLDLGSGQLGNLLEPVLKDGVADLRGRTFEVKSNGKQGLDIRYYFNPVAGGNGISQQGSTPLNTQQSPAASQFSDGRPVPDYIPTEGDFDASPF